MLHRAVRTFKVGTKSYLKSPFSTYAGSTVKLGQFLQKYGGNLTQLALNGKLDPVVGRNDEIERAIQVLSRRKKNNPCLIGEPGVGKTAIAEGLALRIAFGDVPESMKDCVIISLDLASMLAGAKFRGEFEERLKGVLKDIEQAGNKVILFIDEIHILVGAGAAEGAIDASNILKPPLARGLLRCMGATTSEEYRKHIEKDAALARRFQTVFVSEPTVDDTISILRGLRSKYEIHHGIRITDDALIAAARLSDRYIPDRRRPDKAIDLIDESAARMRILLESKPPAVLELDAKLSDLNFKKGLINTVVTEDSKESQESPTGVIITTDIESAPVVADSDATTARESERVQLLKNSSEYAALEATINHTQANRDEIMNKWDTYFNLQRQANDTRVVLDGLTSELERAKKLGDYERVRRMEVSESEQSVKLESQYNQLQSMLHSSSGLIDCNLSVNDVSAVVARNTGIPVGELLEDERKSLLSMEEELGKYVVGQSHAIRAISKCIRLSRAGLRYHDRPLGVFLMLGPTGVGKTELAKALSTLLFQDPSSMFRIDMSEYMERFSVSRLVGAPPGYVGYEEGGILTEAVRRKPYQIILLDEFEKAHREVSNLLLQVFDEGRLSDSHGRVADFKNTVIIMTSNLGQRELYSLDAMSEGGKLSATASNSVAKAIIAQHFAPEFLNRIDEVITFNPLDETAIQLICKQQLSKVTTLLKTRGVALTVSTAAEAWIGATGYDSAFGARPLKRLIQAQVLNPLATLLLENAIKSGDSIHVGVDTEGEPAGNEFDANRMWHKLTVETIDSTLTDTKSVAKGSLVFWVYSLHVPQPNL